jgi:hypothetical protein
MSDIYCLIQTDIKERHIRGKSKGKGKFVPVHPMKAYRGIKGTAALILNLGVRW